MSKKKNYPENIQKLKTQLESGNNLIDYFLVCGISPSTCLDNKLFNLSNDKNENIDNLSEILKPKIITKFPEFDNNNDTIDEEIISYCFPNGFRPSYKDTGDKSEKKFSIILDNNLFSAENPQKYLTCLLFYENLSKYKSLADDLQKLTNNLDISGTSILSDESTSFNSIRSSFQTEVNKTNSKTLYHVKTTSTSFNSDLSSVSSVNFSDTISNMDSTLISQDNKTLRLNSVCTSNVHRLKYYYIPKCICIVSIHPYIKLFQEILLLIYKYSLSSQQVPIEKIIANLIIEVPIAPRGLYYIDFMVLNKKITLKRTENNKLLLSEIDLKKFHTNVQFHIQLEVFKHLLFSSKIIFFSKNINSLCEAILSFLSLIFPFKYPFQVTSYLNKNNYNILESISPFFIGINEEYKTQFFTVNDISTEGMDLLIVDLDNNITELRSEETFPDFPYKAINNLEKEIKNIDKILEEEKKDKKKEENKEGLEEFNYNYQEIYFNFFCELIKNYDEYLNMDYFKNTDKDITTSIETLFNCNQFVKSHSSYDIPFYTKFVSESQLFADFIYKRMIPKNNQEIIDILLVNDTLTKIKNRSKFFGKDATDFLDSNDYQRKNRYIVPRPRELTEFEKSYIKKNKEKLSQKGQIIKIKTINKNDNISFKFNVFPELDFNIYCNNDNIVEYIPPPDYSEEIEAINTDVISKSSLGENINRSIEMKNYLYLSWLEVWAFSFWYIDKNDKNERHYRFNQMLDVLEKVKHHEMNILNLLFDALNKGLEIEMILKLYRKLLELNIHPSTFIYNIISGVIDKDEMRKLKDKKKSTDAKVYSKDIYRFKDYNIKDNKKRTFLSLDDYLEIDTKLKFCSEFSCIQCGEKINLLDICQTFDDVKNDILWVPCTCGEYNLPKIKVRFGRELLRDKIYKTSSTDEIVLHSPYNLKINIKDAVMNNYGTKLNVIDFKIQFKALFWDFIWYCKIHYLDYNIILPYLKDIEELRKINFRNSSVETFEIIFEDKLYKENLKRISKYSNSIYEKYINAQKKINNSKNYIIEQITTYEYIGINKSQITLKNINLNEDEDNENVYENEDNENKGENEGNQENQEKIQIDIKKVMNKDNNDIIEEENNEDDNVKEEEENNNNIEDDKIIKEEKNEEDEDNNSDGDNKNEQDNNNNNNEGDNKNEEEENTQNIQNDDVRNEGVEDNGNNENDVINNDIEDKKIEEENNNQTEDTLKKNNENKNIETNVDIRAEIENSMKKMKEVEKNEKDNTIKNNPQKNENIDKNKNENFLLNLKKKLKKVNPNKKNDQSINDSKMINESVNIQKNIDPNMEYGEEINSK